MPPESELERTITAAMAAAANRGEAEDAIAAARDAASRFVEATGGSREAALAITKLDEAAQWNFNETGQERFTEVVRKIREAGFWSTEAMMVAEAQGAAVPR